MNRSQILSAIVSAAFFGIIEILLCGISNQKKSYCGNIKLAEKASLLLPLLTDFVIDIFIIIPFS